MKDRNITCIQCGASFLFTSAEQERFLARGFDPPRRCPQCRKNKSRIAGTGERWVDGGKERYSRQGLEYDLDER